MVEKNIDKWIEDKNRKLCLNTDREINDLINQIRQKQKTLFLYYFFWVIVYFTP